jgi:hypothetical protein
MRVSSPPQFLAGVLGGAALQYSRDSGNLRAVRHFAACEELPSIRLLKSMDRRGGVGLNSSAGFSRRRLLNNYEIRILKKGHKAPFIYSCPQASDYAAVRRAQSLVEEGDDVEVWRDLNCVYSTRKTMQDDVRHAP